MSETSYELGVGLGVALLGSVHAAAYAGQMAGAPTQAAESIGGAKEYAEHLPAAEAAGLMERARDAFDSALSTTSYVSIGIAAAVLVLVVWMVPGSFRTTGSGHYN